MSAAHPFVSCEEETPRPVSTTVYSGGLMQFRAFREAIGDTCDIVLPGNLDSFQAHNNTVVFGNAVLSEMRSVSLNYSRRARHIARSGYSHYQINANLAGQTVFHCGRQNVVLRPGDVCILDTTRPLEAFAQARPGGESRSLSLFLPREVLAPFLPHASGGHCTLISGGVPDGRLLYEHLIALMSRARTASTVLLETAVKLIVERVASALEAHAVSPDATLWSIKRYLDAHLHAPDRLSSEVICHRFACSRATLYRLFENEGGLVNYIQRRRLQHALMELIAPGSRRRIIDIAMENHFSGESTFNRAFRRQFDITPGEARRLAQIPQAPDNALVLRASEDPGPLAIRWIRELGPLVRPAGR